MLEIREMSEDDVDVCIEIMRAYESYKSIGEDSARKNCTDPDWEHYVGSFEGDVAGLVNFDVAKDFTDGITIHDIYVRKDFRSRGVGTRLVGRVEEECKKEKFSFLYAVSVQTDAIKFYERLNFERISGKSKDAPLCYRKNVQI